MFFQEVCCTFCCFNVEAQLIETTDQRQCFFFIFVSDCCQYCTVVLDVHVCSLQSFVQRSVQFVVVTDRFTCGFHFGGQVCVHAVQFGEGECGNFYIPSLFFIGIQTEDALFFQGFAQDRQCCDICQRVTCCFGQERYCSGGTRVNFDYIYIIFVVNDELNVEQTNDADTQTQFLCVFQDFAFCFVGYGECRVYGDGVTGVYACSFYVFHDTGYEYVDAVTNSVNFQFFTLDIFVNQYGLVFIDCYCSFQVCSQLFFISNDLHCTAAQYVGRTNQYRVTDFVCCFYTSFDVCYSLTFRLRDTQFTHDVFEGVSVFCFFDGFYICTDDFYAAFHQRFCQVDRCLTTQGSDDAQRLFQFNNVHNVFYCQRFEVQFVTCCVVCGNCFGVVVDDDGFVAEFFDCCYSMYCGVVEFYTLTDTDRTGTQYDDFFLVAQSGVVYFFICGVEVGDITAAAGCFDHFVNREQIHFFSQIEYCNFIPAPQFCDEFIGDAHFLSNSQDFFVANVFGQCFFVINDLLEGFQEVHCDFCCFEDFVQRYAVSDQLSDCIDSVVRACCDVCQHFFVSHIIEFSHVQVANADFQRAYGFQQTFFQCTADTHNFTSCFHLCGQCVCSCCEFIEGETRHFCYDVVQSGFVVCCCFADLDFIQAHTYSDFRCYSCDRETGCFGSQCGGTGYTRVNFDQVVLRRVGVQCELNVAAAFDLQFFDDLQSGFFQHVEVVIIQCQDRSNYDGVTCVNANGVDVFHTTDCDRVVCTVTHYFEFDFFITFYALFNQYLMYGRQFQRIFHDFDQFSFVVCKAAACTAQCECRTQYYGVTDFVSRFDTFFNGVCDHGRDNGFADGFTHFFEQFTVFCSFDTFDGCTQQFYLTFFQNAFFRQLHSQVQTCLTADTGQDRVGSFVTQNFSDVFQCQGFHVHFVCDCCVCHDCSRVGVNQYYFIAFFFQGKASLCTCIVKFSSLADYDRAGADDQDFFQVGSLWHNFVLLVSKCVN